MEVLHLASVAYSEIVAVSGMVVVVRVAASEVVVLFYIAFCVWGWLATRVQVFSVLS